jgi:UDP-2-acetamido-2,6-beta-L-arabino-hexul-4-ose reductase
MSRVVVTGALGFVGRNLMQALSRGSGNTVSGFDLADPVETWVEGIGSDDTLIHLAGVNRPEAVEEFHTGNVGVTQRLVEQLQKRPSAPQLLFASSIQAECDSPYGRSKHAAEQVFRAFAESTGARVRIFRLPNVFGKWCRPNYNSAVATFCHNVARGLPIQIHDPESPLRLVYVDDVVRTFLGCVQEPGEAGAQLREVEPVFHTTVGQVADLVHELARCCRTPWVPDVSDPFRKRMLATFVSYLPSGELCQVPEPRSDARGWLVELLKSASAGQLFASVTVPGAVRGNHYHDTKVEKFCVLTGDATIELRRVDSSEVVLISVRDGTPAVVNIPPGTTHAIRNTGRTDVVVVFWASEVFDPAAPDTFACEVRA